MSLVWLRVLSGADAGRTVELPEDRPFVLGRVQGCDLVIRDERASRQHAELRVEPAGGRAGASTSGRRTARSWTGGGSRRRCWRAARSWWSGGVEIAVLARRPASEGGDAPPPTWSVVGRLVDSRTRGARRATWAALGAAGAGARGGRGACCSWAAATTTGAAGGAQASRRRRCWSRRCAATGGPRPAPAGCSTRGEGLVVTAAHVINEGERYRVAVGGRGAAGVARRRPRRARTSRCCGCRQPRADGRAARRAAPALEQGETVVALGFPAGAAPEDARDLDARRGVGARARRSATRRPTCPPTRTPSRPTPRSTPATPAARWPTSTAAWSASTPPRARPARTAGALEGQNFAIGIDRARRGAGAAPPRPLGGVDGRDVRLPDDRGARRAQAPARAVRDRRGARDARPRSAGVAGRGEVLAGIDGRRVGTTLQSYCDAMAGQPQRRDGDVHARRGRAGSRARSRWRWRERGRRRRLREAAFGGRRRVAARRRPRRRPARAGWGRRRRVVPLGRAAAHRLAPRRRRGGGPGGRRRRQAGLRAPAARRRRCGTSRRRPRIRSPGSSPRSSGRGRPIVALACDMPFVTPDLIARLAAHDGRRGPARRGVPGALRARRARPCCAPASRARPRCGTCSPSSAPTAVAADPRRADRDQRSGGAGAGGGEPSLSASASASASSEVAARQRGEPARDRRRAALGRVRGDRGELEHRRHLGVVGHGLAERLGELRDPLLGGGGHARTLACRR